jgi:hypothetical protein
MILVDYLLAAEMLGPVIIIEYKLATAFLQPK